MANIDGVLSFTFSGRDNKLLHFTPHNNQTKHLFPEMRIQNYLIHPYQNKIVFKKIGDEETLFLSNL